MSDPYWPFDGPRSFLFVSSSDPELTAETVGAWTDGPPDLCIAGPSTDARLTAAMVSAGRYVDVQVEPRLGGQGPYESLGDMEARRADVFRLLHEYETRAALVVSDGLFDPAELPFALDADGLLQRAASIERTLRLS